MQTRKKILMFGYAPPPYFGPAVAYGALLRSRFMEEFDVTFINLSVVSDLRDLEKFSVAKLLKLAKFFFLEFWYLLTDRFDFVCYPVSFNHNAFLKDALLLGLARAFGVPTVLWAHGNNLPDFYSRSPRWMQRVIDATIKNAVGGIVLGERLRFNFQQQLPDEKIFSVPLGIEMPAAPPTRRPDARLRTVLYLGNLIREKGVFVLLEAIPRVLEKHPDTRFVFAGAWWNDDERRAAEQIVRDQRIESSVVFTGLVVGETKRHWLTTSDLLVFPTFYYYETFGLVLLEAMWAGLPVIATARASIPEIVEDGVNGLLVNEQDVDDLAAKMVRLLSDPELRRRMGEANRQKFREYYTHEHYGQRMSAVFEKVSTL